MNDKEALAKEFTYNINIVRMVPRKEHIEAAMMKLNITGVHWKKVKNFINARVQHAKKHN